jgi:DeoR/GlpR family transcriptional regulator of sugar metabolism
MKIDNLDYKKQFFQSLNERQRRHFAAIEAKELGHGGIKAVSTAFGVSVVTVRQGITELETNDRLAEGRVRKKGGGRKKTPE